MKVSKHYYVPVYPAGQSQQRLGEWVLVPWAGWRVDAAVCPPELSPSACSGPGPRSPHRPLPPAQHKHWPIRDGKQPYPGKLETIVYIVL